MGNHWLSLLRPRPALHPPRMDSESVVDLVTGVRPSGRPGPTERSRSRNRGTPCAGRCLRARERCRWLGIDLTGNGSPTAIHPARTVTPVPSAALVTPASTLQDVPVSLDLSPEDFAGVPELLDFTLPGSDDSHHESRVTGCALGIPHGPILQDTASTAQALSSTGGPKIRVEQSSEDSKSP